MLEAAQATCTEALPLKEAPRITVAFLVAHESALELHDTGEAHIMSVPQWRGRGKMAPRVGERRAGNTTASLAK